MKKQILSLVVLLAVSFVAVHAQDGKDKSKRPSPPAKAEGTINGAKIVIDYSTPFVKGRKIFGEGKDFLQPFGEVWRAGANEATTFGVDKDVKIEGKDLPKGKYALFAIPREKEWTIIFSKKADQWGTEYNEADDFLRVTVKPGKTKKLIEQFNIAIEKDKVILRWENTEVGFAVK